MLATPESLARDIRSKNRSRRVTKIHKPWHPTVNRMAGFIAYAIIRGIQNRCSTIKIFIEKGTEPELLIIGVANKLDRPPKKMKAIKLEMSEIPILLTEMREVMYHLDKQFEIEEEKSAIEKPLHFFELKSERSYDTGSWTLCIAGGLTTTKLISCNYVAKIFGTKLSTLQSKRPRKK